MLSRAAEERRGDDPAVTHAVERGRHERARQQVGRQVTDARGLRDGRHRRGAVHPGGGGGARGLGEAAGAVPTPHGLVEVRVRGNEVEVTSPVPVVLVGADGGEPGAARAALRGPADKHRRAARAHPRRAPGVPRRELCPRA